ncbi:S8 family serine peptidase [Embleya scabrispora]|uniref:S8 family serine peptidase n=1 Tax=Embleya scabrispora TaxID=159449 RepID=UPI00035CBEDF|nr:S8 family serine peptidase [Embleya scabrispora]MYS86849.1 S8 family serine peptidase [Streptomyces sp. SID5474]
MSPIDEKHDSLISNGILDLGDPTGDEEELYDGGSCRAYIFGRIYFHPRVGEAFEMHGLIMESYLGLGAETSGLGYPITDEADSPDVAGGRMNAFELGTITFDPVSGINVRTTDPQVAPQVIVKIADGVFVPLGQGGSLDLNRFAADVLGPGSEFAVEAVRALLPDLALSRVFDGVSGDRIQVMVDQAVQEEPDYERTNFDNYLEIDCPVGFDTETLASAMAAFGGNVEFAYSMPLASDPAVVGTTNPLFFRQGYLDPALDGIGVQAAWANGADGSGTRFIDVEQGWFVGHEDLPPGLRLIDGINTPLSFAHGTAVVGSIVGIDNARGICGIAPNSSARMISYFHSKEAFNSPADRQRVANAILRAQSELSSGDVLLLEVQFQAQFNGVPRFVPVETDPGCFAAIALATARGVIVVEAAGNKNANLDEFRDPTSNRRVLNRNEPGEFRESRAIMVGSGTSVQPHGRIQAENATTGASLSSFGSRVDCFAWGENIVTTGNPNTPTKRDAYWTGPFFGGTSGAAAIIAGVCLLVQDLFTRLNPGVGAPGKLGPNRMRTVLTTPSNSTAGAPGASIGVMPDLKKLIAHEFV